jgi:hypothetical protein
VLERLLVGLISTAASAMAGKPAVYAPRNLPPPPIRMPAPQRPPLPPPEVEVPNDSANELAKLYVKTARELSALERTKGPDAAIDLWPRFRWIRINEALTSPPKRAETYQILDQLRRDVAAVP